MNQILVLGDTHGDTSSICNIAIPMARKKGCKIIVQVGDFGYWEHQQAGARFLNKVSKCLVRENLTMLWIDGNHENHPLLWEKYPEIRVSGYPSFYDGMSEIRENLFYIPRGHVIKIGPANCLFVGGAWSIDRDWRLQEEAITNKPHTLWWETETLTEADVRRAIRRVEVSDPIDLMFTHDVPTGLNVPGVHDGGNEIFPESTRNRMMLREIFDVARPRMLVHGHYHVRYTGKLPLRPVVRLVGEQDWDALSGDDSALLDWDYCRVDGLDCNGHSGFCVVLDLDSLFIGE